MAQTMIGNRSGDAKTGFSQAGISFPILLPYFYNILLPFSRKNKLSCLQTRKFSDIRSRHGKETNILQAESRGSQEAQVHCRRAR
jgi:hypothetical protein